MDKKQTLFQRTHNFINKHTIIGLFLLIFSNMILSEVLIGGVCAALLGLIGVNPYTVSDLLLILGGLLCLWLYRRFYRNEYHPVSFKKNFKSSLILAYPIYGLWIFIIGMYIFMIKRFPLSNFDMPIIMRSVSAGLAEEVVFREISVSYLIRQWKGKNREIAIVTIPAVIFGLFHLVNIVNGNSVVNTLYQVMICLFAGLFYGAIYLIKGNVWPLIILHSAHDFIVLSEENMLTSMNVTIPQTINSVYMFGFMLIAIYAIFIIENADSDYLSSSWAKIWQK